MYLGGPVGAFGIGILMTGVIGYRVEQYKLGIERKEAEDISDEKGKHLMKNIYDLLLIVISIAFFRSFILKKHFFEKEKILRENAPVIFLPLTVALILNIFFIVMIDIKVINSHFEMYAYNLLEFFGFVWVGLSVYTRWKYDKEHEHNMTKGEGAIIGVILLVLILLFLHL